MANLLIHYAQEEEWGLKWLEKEQFLKWSSRYITILDKEGQIDSKQASTRKILTEQQLIDLMEKHYSFDIMIKKLR